MKILIIGANGQIGTELAIELAKLHGERKKPSITDSDPVQQIQGRVPGLQHETLDVTDAGALSTI